MKGEQVKELFKKTSVRVTGIVLAAAIAVGSIWAANYQATSIPELVTFIDTDEVVTVSEDEVPLAESTTKVTTSTKTTKKTTIATAKKKAKKTYSKTGKAKTKTTTKTSTSKTSTATKKTTTKTTVKTQTTSKYTKGSKKYKKITTTKTTVKKTVVTTPISSSSSSSSTSSGSGTTATTIEALAPKVDSRVVTAWNKLGFSFVINSSVSYSGLFDAKSQTITLKTTGDTVYHELGHFVAFVAGNVDTSSSFVTIYNAEKDLVTSYNKTYVTQSSSEYFAESFKEYTLDPTTLKASRPQTYAAIVAALDKITTAQITKIATTYASIWS
ncbi:MAG: hypothetical protein LUF35_12915 [Lachnospiraceae bacterium]|nr:hypothetical protein [Lachnospiraceae bacterium]